MNPQTYDDIKAEVISRLGNRQDLDARADQWIMDAFTELTQTPMASFRELDALYDCVAHMGQPKLDVPADFWFILSLRDLTRKLDQVHWQVLDRTYRTLGMPTRFARYQNHIELDPIPNEDTKLIMRYRRRLPKLVPGLVIPLEREWHELLITLSVAKGLTALQRYEEAVGYKGSVDAQVANRVDTVTLEEDGYESTIGVRFK